MAYTRQKLFSEKQKVKCPHLLKWLPIACNADYKLYFPSLFQLQNYCDTKEHKKCPFFKEFGAN
jgi:hypothetical protein